MQNYKTKNAIKVLVGSKKVILSRLRQVVKTGSFNYRTFGTAIEEYISDILIEIFKKADFVENDKDYILAPNKNHFPDFQLKTSPILAIEYKSGNEIKLEKGKWALCKKRENGVRSIFFARIKKDKRT
jgi:hypothetical protein